MAADTPEEVDAEAAAGVGDAREADDGAGEGAVGCVVGGCCAAAAVAVGGTAPAAPAACGRGCGLRARPRRRRSLSGMARRQAPRRRCVPGAATGGWRLGGAASLKRRYAVRRGLDLLARGR
jgi:hypothetical protein